ncbi:RlpA-like double-psi beta-barrel-protein domain-containing protein-containing protein [Ganoderma leucocontextum]|nr:RlpA-like double-psi beta-barrel-protein domain-containing protein-containing protein [Ganoderma leucocontextum]
MQYSLSEPRWCLCARVHDDQDFTIVALDFLPFNLSNMRFTAAALIVALSAATSSFALTEKGGNATTYDPGLGSCGVFSTATEFVVAVDAHTMRNFPGGAVSNPMLNPICQRKMKVTYNGKSVTAMIVDTCPATKCKVGSIELSPPAFKRLAPLKAGRLENITWTLLPKA